MSTQEPFNPGKNFYWVLDGGEGTAGGVMRAIYNSKDNCFFISDVSEILPGTNNSEEGVMIYLHQFGMAAYHQGTHINPETEDEECYRVWWLTPAGCNMVRQWQEYDVAQELGRMTDEDPFIGTTFIVSKFDSVRYPKVTEAVKAGGCRIVGETLSHVIVEAKKLDETLKEATQ